MFQPDRLVKWRKKRKLTQDDLAEKISLTKAAISNYENGHSAPSHDTLTLIADVLDISTDYLLGRTDDPTSPNHRLDSGRAYYGGASKYSEEEQFVADAAVEAYRKMKGLNK
ncbi:helix-turn-helix domain-containing protein [Paenibacillus sp. YN15]|uniref:helix-turn-helix domain-containing protein n=1 Tax=Paenibacillus sp. YN15 TaxID=1742774 RepID=UPI000DCB4A11|nr:helix-turn-helix transcriptional regulator [Paenibacillus sp. YN15]RAU92483.1 XRE family transcriptional regulator [Paenibacillus sp. YN15]